MNSSISSSDLGRWRGFLALYAKLALGLGLAAAALLVVADPYDSGRFALFGRGMLAKTGPRLADASRGRNPAFDSAVIGNSHSQILSPERLSEGLGGRFVSLSIPGTGPREQLLVAEWFLRHHGGGTRTLVVGVDQSWCRPDALTTQVNPFPDWLYAESAVEYLRGLMQTSSFEAVGKKIGVMLGKAIPARPDGFDDYEADRTWSADDMHRIAKTQMPDLAPARGQVAPSSMAAVAALDGFLARLPAQVAVVAVFPPVHTSVFPPQGTVSGANLAACKSAVQALAAARPRQLAVVDFLRDDDLARAEENFWDGTHYRGHVARRMEQAVAQAAARLRGN
ncbi:MAG TPA: hypothetical protein VK196_15250 [Magnetospirillum sp.]|nr:hypothetical protein [Magnetospirillum sp.]